MIPLFKNKGLQYCQSCLATGARLDGDVYRKLPVDRNVSFNSMDVHDMPEEALLWE